MARTKLVKTGYIVGTTDHGNKVHIGIHICFHGRGKGRTEWAISFCGANMYGDHWSRIPTLPLGRADDYCKNCARSIAWDVMEKTADVYAKQMNASVQLEKLLAQATEENWSLEQLTGALSLLTRQLSEQEQEIFPTPGKIQEELKEEDEVPNKLREPEPKLQLRLVPKSA